MKGEMKVIKVNGGYEKKEKWDLMIKKWFFYFVESDALPDTETSVGLRRTTLSLTSSAKLSVLCGNGTSIPSARSS